MYVHMNTSIIEVHVIVSRRKITVKSLKWDYQINRTLKFVTPGMAYISHAMLFRPRKKINLFLVMKINKFHQAGRQAFFFFFPKYASFIYQAK